MICNRFVKTLHQKQEIINKVKIEMFNRFKQIIINIIEQKVYNFLNIHKAFLF